MVDGYMHLDQASGKVLLFLNLSIFTILAIFPEKYFGAPRIQYSM